MTASDDDRPVGRDPDARLADGTERYEESSYFLIRLADSIYALPATGVDHVADAEEPLRVPTSPPVILGVLHLRGRIVAVVDIAALLGLPARGGDSGDTAELGRRLVVIETTGRFYGFDADETLGIVDVRTDDVRRAGDDDVFTGQFDHPRGVVTILVPEVLLARILGAGQTAASA